MTRRTARATLLFLLVAALAGAGVFIVIEERHADAARTAAMEVDLVAWRVLHDVAEAGAGLQAYAVPGQNEAAWQTKVTAALASAAGAVDDLRNRLNDPGALSDLDAAAAALDTLGQVESRAARLVGFDNRAQAGSLVFSEGLEARATVTQRIEAARQAEQQAIARSLLARRKLQGAAAAGAGVLALLIATVLAVRTGEAPAEAAPAAVLNLAEPAPREVTRSHEAGGADETARQAEPEPAREPSHALALPAGNAVPTAPDLRAAADLCTDFARVIDSQELPALLARSADLLEASGLIVWIADPQQQRLRPLLAHGYTAQALARIPAIPSEADNATAAAYRNGRVEVVRSDGSSPGAVVVPVVTGEGCVGAMSAEVRPGRESNESTFALARIVAAQLAAIVTIAPPRQAEPPAPMQAVGAD